MFQKSVLSATYISCLHIQQNRLIQTLLIGSKGAESVIWHHSMAWGVEEATTPINSKEKNKAASPEIKKCGRKVIPNTGSSDPVPVHKRRGERGLSSCWGSPQPKGQGEEHRELQSCLPVTFPQGWRAHAKCDSSRAPPCKLHPHHARSNNSVLGQAIFPSPCVRKMGPKDFLVGRCLFSQSIF